MQVMQNKVNKERGGVIAVTFSITRKKNDICQLSVGSPIFTRNYPDAVNDEVLRKILLFIKLLDNKGLRLKYNALFHNFNDIRLVATILLCAVFGGIHNCALMLFPNISLVHYNVILSTVLAVVLVVINFFVVNRIFGKPIYERKFRYTYYNREYILYGMSRYVEKDIEFLQEKKLRYINYLTKITALGWLTCALYIFLSVL